MATVDSLESIPHICVYGPPASGKTTLVASLAEHYNLLWFDIENGWSVMKQLPKEWQARINLVHLPDSTVYPIAAETLPKIIRGTNVKVCVAHGKVNCPLCAKTGSIESITLDELPRNTIVVIDSLTQFGMSTISHITKHQPDEYKLQLDDWGRLKIAVEKFLSQIQAAPFAVICITHEESVECEDGRERLVPVCGSSKTSRNTGKYFTDAIYCNVVNKKHTYSSMTTDNNRILAFSSFNVDISKLSQPSLYPFVKAFCDSSQPIIIPNTVSDSTATTGNKIPVLTSIGIDITKQQVLTAQEKLAKLKSKL